MRHSERYNYSQLRRRVPAARNGANPAKLGTSGRLNLARICEWSDAGVTLRGPATRLERPTVPWDLQSRCAGVKTPEQCSPIERKIGRPVHALCAGLFSFPPSP